MGKEGEGARAALNRTVSPHLCPTVWRLLLPKKTVQRQFDESRVSLGIFVSFLEPEFSTVWFNRVFVSMHPWQLSLREDALRRLNQCLCSGAILSHRVSGYQRFFLYVVEFLHVWKILCKFLDVVKNLSCCENSGWVFKDVVHLNCSFIWNVKIVGMVFITSRGCNDQCFFINGSLYFFLKNISTNEKENSLKWDFKWLVFSLKGKIVSNTFYFWKC